MGSKKAQKMCPVDPKAEKQYREKEIAHAIYQREEKTQLPKAKKTIVDIDDENTTLASMINKQTLVPLENVRDPGSQLYCRILYIFGMTPNQTF